MLQFDPTDPEEIAFTLHKAVKKSGLPLTQYGLGLANTQAGFPMKLSSGRVGNVQRRSSYGLR